MHAILHLTIFNSTYRRHLHLNILIENSAWQKNSIGSKFDEIGYILDILYNKNLGFVLLSVMHLLPDMI